MKSEGLMGSQTLLKLNSHLVSSFKCEHFDSIGNWPPWLMCTKSSTNEGRVVLYIIGCGMHLLLTDVSMPDNHVWKTSSVILPSIHQSINQFSIAPICPAKPDSVAWQSNWYSTAKSMNQFHNINWPLGMLVSKGERPSQRDVSWVVSWR